MNAVETSFETNCQLIVKGSNSNVCAVLLCGLPDWLQCFASYIVFTESCTMSSQNCIQKQMYACTFATLSNWKVIIFMVTLGQEVKNGLFSRHRQQVFVMRKIWILDHTKRIVFVRFSVPATQMLINIYDYDKMVLILSESISRGCWVTQEMRGRVSPRVLSSILSPTHSTTPALINSLVFTAPKVCSWTNM